ncbi:MAG TPA: hypothetical protein VHC22_19145 [Pirellulales bacterium]|nr:hypothetical protein [Pirellulales bacterium]
MAKANKKIAPPLIDAVRPMDADGPLASLICSTYGLSLDQPNFFEQDFLPTVLGLGGVRDRGYAVPVAMERKLKEVYSALAADAHALANGGRPSLQIDIIPIGHRTNHAKIVLIHRKRLIRLVIASANLTHEGYRRQREIAVILDFKDGGALPLAVLRTALDGWSAILGTSTSVPMQKAFDAAIRQAQGWALPATFTGGRKMEVVFGGGPKPLWRALVEAWPEGEEVLDWCVCSPFWPDSTGGETPFEAIARGLDARGAHLENARLRIMTCADSPGEKARPKFPFQLARKLFEGGFPVRNGYIAAARLEALREEIPEGTAEDHRELHAKWVLLRGPTTAVMLIGSANFTRMGLGVGARPETANIEACVLITVPATEADPEVWMRPLAEEGIVDLASFQESQFQEAALEEDDSSPWPDFIVRIEVVAQWENGPDPVGSVRAILRPGQHPAFSISPVHERNEPPSTPLISVAEDGAPVATPADAQAIRRILTSRMVLVTWGEPSACVRFPVNIDEGSKAALPSVLGARPDEQQLLAYFHGRISEEDLIELLEQRAAQALTGTLAPTPQEAERLRQLQSYLLRDFVESLFGLAETLRQSMRSPRAFEQALIGDFSPVSLAEQVLQAFRAGRRSPTAAAFQFVELIQVVAGLQLTPQDGQPIEEIEALEEVRARGLSRLLALAACAAERAEFCQTCCDRDFSRYVAASLPAPVAKQWTCLFNNGTTVEAATTGSRVGGALS